MAKVRMKVSIASPDFSYVPQQEVELEDDLAAKWVEVDHAEYIEDPKKKGGVKNGTKVNKSSTGGTSKSGGNANVSKSG